MVGLRIFTSNRLEVLAEKLAEILRAPLALPLTAEVVVVQSRGMERWISLELARHHGICANVRFPFPKAFAYDLFREAMPDLPFPSPYEPEAMAWRIMGILPLHLDKPEFSPLRRYLVGAGSPDGLKLFQLAGRIAWVFDQYLVFRPEMIIAWESGAEGGWQAELWRSIVQEAGVLHPAALHRVFLTALRGNAPLPSLPERVSVFGVTTLPRFYLEILEAVARHTAVNLFVMNPSREFWGEIRSDREIGRISERIRQFGREESPVDEEALYLERGNSLLASLGALGREFFANLTGFAGEERDEFIEPGEATLLSSIQSDILHLRERGRDGSQRAVIASSDRSIQIHSCHSPMREVEALHDALLALFAADPELLPRDIIVMTPDIETYAPLIEAVFAASPGAAGGDDAGRIPFSIADRSIRGEGEITGAFLKILELPESRFGVSQVLGLLDTPAIREAFSLSEEEAARVRRWVTETWIRWGRDGEDRRSLGLPATEVNTWKWGLERLLLGYALPGDGDRLFSGILPFGGVEGSEARILGRFAAFVDGLFACVSALREGRSLKGWAHVLTDILDRLFRCARDEELRMLRQTMQRLADGEEQSGFSGPVELDVVLSWLKQTLAEAGFGSGFLTGGVTFCAMLPMRSVPSRVVCLLGMNDGFPRQEKSLGFDLIARHPRPGDRSRRKDDRFLFLEALLSAREKFIISYVGQSIKDNSVIPPSVVVSELLDYIGQGFIVEGQIVIIHRLQAFSPEYFLGTGGLYSFSAENCRAARALIGAKAPPMSFVGAPLPEADTTARIVDIADLVRFFRNPARFFAQKRLRITIPGEEEAPEDVENFDLAKLDRYGVAQSLVQWALAHDEIDDYLPVLRASGRIPHGSVGLYCLEKLSHEVRRFIAETHRYLTDEQLAPVDLDLSIGDFRITGRIEGIHNCGRVAHRFAALKAKDHLQAWVNHVVMNLAASSAYPRNTILLGQDEYWLYEPAADAGDVLAALMRLYWQGLREPLRFFPDSSWKYADAVVRLGKAEDAALRAAAASWEGNEFARGEVADTYFAMCFEEGNPLDEMFQRLAVEILTPLLEHQVKL